MVALHSNKTLTSLFKVGLNIDNGLIGSDRDHDSIASIYSHILRTCAFQEPSMRYDRRLVLLRDEAHQR